MNKIIGLFSLLLFLNSCSSVKKYNTEITTLHTPENLKSDVDKTYRKLKKLHPKLYQFVSKASLDAKFDSLKQNIRSPMTSVDFYKKLAPVVSEIRQGHISISPPSKRFTKKERKDLNKREFEFYDIAFEKVDDAFLIKDNFGIDSTLIGAEVLKVEKRLINDVLNDYKKYFSSDGYNTTFEERYVALRFSNLYYRDKGYQDSLQVTLSQQDRIFTKTFRRIPKDSIKNILKVSDSLKNNNLAQQDSKPVKLSREEKKRKKEKVKTESKNNRKYGFIRSKKLSKSDRLFTRNFDFIGEDSTVAYLKIRGFTNGSYKEFYKEVFVKIDSAKAKNLVIDLRDNTGGRLDEIANLYSYLATTNYQFIEKGQTKTRFPFLKGTLSSQNPVWLNALGILASPFAAPVELLKGSKKGGVRYYNFSASKKDKTPNALSFKGKIYVLINGNSFSASSILSTNLKATGRAIFVGEETGGHYNGTVAGVSKFVRLPNSKISLSFGLIQIQAPYQTEINGYGIPPDVEIIPTFEDRRKGVDPELNWILNNIKNK